MKKAFFILTLFLSSIAFAKSMMTIGFGRDGATGKSMPDVNSTAQAAKVFKALNLQADDRGRKSIETETYEIEAQDSGFSLILDMDSHETTIRKSGKIDGIIPVNVGTISFKGPAAEDLAKALPVANNLPSVGAVNKGVANIVCTRPSIPNAYFTCTLENVNYLELSQ